MIAFFLFLSSFFRRIRNGLRDPEFRGLFYSVALLLLFGTWFYRTVEGWSWVDSFYFTVITLSTVGYGDFSPTTLVAKLFTVLYIILGLGLLSSFIFKLAELSADQRPQFFGGLRRGSDDQLDEEDVTAVNPEENQS